MREALTDKIATRLIALSRPRKAVVIATLDALLAMACLALVLQLAPALSRGGLGGNAWLLVLTGSGLAAVASLGTGLARLPLKDFAMLGAGKAVVLSCLLALALWAVLGWQGGDTALFFGCAFLSGIVVQRRALLALTGWLYRRSNVVSRIAIYGATPEGIALARALRDRSGFLTCAYLDDSPVLRGATLDGVPVLGPAVRETLIRKFNVDRVVLADPRLPEPRKAALARDLSRLVLRCEALPDFALLVGGADLAARLEPVRPERWLGRCEITGGDPPEAEFYRGKSVLISGAGGSIGAELCRQILVCGPAKLVLLELSEPALFALLSDLTPLAARAGVDLVTRLGSAGDTALVREIFAQEAIDAVFHAAAYKHVALVEENPLSGFANNVTATVCLARGARAAKVARFVLISSDKAIAPSSAMGASKRMAELVVQDLSTRAGATVFSIVRFGNVIGSSGSVVPIFERQIAQGGPLTLTDPDATRYFMTIAEAARLVLIAGRWEISGRVYALDMGAPIRIGDLARQMVEARGLRLRGPDCPDGEIELLRIGLRRGEKLHEAPVTGAHGRVTAHPKIRHAPVAHLSERETALLLRDLDVAVAQRCRERLEELISTLRRIEGDALAPLVLDEASRLQSADAREIDVTAKGWRRQNGTPGSEVASAVNEDAAFVPAETRGVAVPTRMPFLPAPPGARGASGEGVARIADRA
ncbi:polysaccharide biosynthesis protein [Thioclava electrotropha]|uniref:Polysaccharide biosynthesis protein n=1 Tax=Thioclava electrotropha TaxID=1549850 RepID=A0ABX6YXV0_9RHOB|nr:polysaccharide biosynthesis protein [Thioclava electrotropha]QPZ92694.1 polysaccharide biosynthesis protein [Thioclava electrotropha]